MYKFKNKYKNTFNESKERCWNWKYLCFRSLFLSKINPVKQSNKLTIDECKQLTASSKKILNSAIKYGGTTIKDFYSADGNAGYFKIKLNVYGREGLDCRKCDAKIKKVAVNKRATFYCSQCQS